MSENQNRGIGDLSKYDAMTTEELEEILRLDAQAPLEQESDTDKILYIMEVLTNRYKNNGHTGKTAHEAYESFKQNYMPETDNTKSTASSKTKRANARWLRRLTATAAILAILLVGSLTTKAFGFDLWKTVVQWTQQTFHFGQWGDSDKNNDLVYDSLQDALEQGKVSVALAPTWFPDGYKLVDITEERTPAKKIYRAKYVEENQFLIITVRDYLDQSPVYVEQSEGLVEEYIVSGITYYIFENNKQVQAAWIVDSYECNISGNITIDELKQMIDSIKKG